MYFVVTPLKNEEKNLPGLIKSIANQSIKPILWVMVDDGSEDSSFKIITEAKNLYPWIYCIKLDKSERDLGYHYSIVCAKGFEYAFNLCKKNNIEYEYIALVDADMILPQNYFEFIIDKFLQDPELGIASGGTVIFDNNKKIKLNLREDIPDGGQRVWSKKCFVNTGGFPIGLASDSVSNVIAKLNGWKVKRFEEIDAFQTRMTSSAEGLWKGWKWKGKAAYFLYTPLIYIILKSIKYTFKRPYYLGIAFSIGYFNSWISRDKQIIDRNLRRYYRSNLLIEIKNHYINLLKKVV